MNRKHEQTVGTFEHLPFESSSIEMDMDSPKWNFALHKITGTPAPRYAGPSRGLLLLHSGKLGGCGAPACTQKCAVRTQPFGELRNQMCDQSRYAKHNDARTHTIPALSSKYILNGKCTADWHNYMQLKNIFYYIIYFLKKIRRNLSGLKQPKTDVAC